MKPSELADQMVCYHFAGTNLPELELTLSETERDYLNAAVALLLQLLDDIFNLGSVTGGIRLEDDCMSNNLRSIVKKPPYNVLFVTKRGIIFRHREYVKLCKLSREERAAVREIVRTKVRISVRTGSRG